MAINNVFDATISFPWGDEDAYEKLAEGFYAANGRSSHLLEGITQKAMIPWFT